VKRTLSVNGRAALLHARRGYAVFPVHAMDGDRCDCYDPNCSSPGKHPCSKGAFKYAMRDAKEIRKRWFGWPNVNVGIATGAVSGIVALDVDPAHGGEESLARLEKEHGALPATRTVKTGGGGRHLYFKHPGGTVPCSIGKIGAGLDVRGDDGYVVAPPSNHASGGTYEWLDERESVDAPAWLLALMCGPRKRATATIKNPTTTPVVANERCDFGPSGGTPYGLAALKRETRRVATTPEGGRNDALNKAAFAAGQLVAGGELERRFAAARLLDAGVAAGLGRAEIMRTAKSGFGKGFASPRSAPPHGDTTPARRRNPPAATLDPRIVSPSPGGTAAGDDVVDDIAAPLWRPFPVTCLPKVLADVVTEGATAIGCDPSYVALPVLAVAAAAIGNSRTIRLKKSWDEPCVVWTAIVGESGTAKSPAQDIAFAPLRRRDEEAQREHVENLKNYKAEKLRYDVALTEWRKDGAFGDPPAEPARPVARRFVVCDATTEAQAKLLAENPRGLLLARDELAGWLRSFDAYRGGKGGDAAFYLATHGARQHTVDRKGGDTPTIFVPRAALSISGSIQPRVLASCIGTQHREDGLLARLLLAMPPRTAPRWTTAVVDDLVKAAYAKTIDDLVALELRLDGTEAPEPVPVPLTDDATAEWVRFFDRFAARQGDTVGDEASALAKLVGYAARFALIHQLARDPGATMIDVAAVTAGATLCEWFADEAVRVYSTLSESADDAARRGLITWIAAAPRNGRTTLRDLARGPREFRSKAAAQAALDELVEEGLGAWEVDHHDGGPGRPVSVFVLKKNVAPEALPRGDGDTIQESSLAAAELCRREGIVSPPVAASADGGACGA
jgi:hypothetical protein